MSDENTPAGTVAPAAPVTPAAPAAPAVQVQPQGDPDWLPERLTRAQEAAKKALLSELGISDPEKAKAAIAAAKKAEDEAKSIADRLTDTTSKLTKTLTEAEHLRAVTTEWAARQMMALTPEQQAAVKAIAGEDAAQQLKTITALQPTWAAAAPARPAAPAPTTPAGGTAPRPNAPDATNVSNPNHREVYLAMQKENPFKAAAYGLQYAKDVFPDS